MALGLMMTKRALFAATKRALTALLAVSVLASCGSTANDPAVDILRGLSQRLLNRNAGSAAPAAAIGPRDILTRAIINTAATPLILVEIPETGDSATLQRIARNGGNETWKIGETTTLTLTANGVLRQTRGLGFDLYASDIGPIEAALRARAPGPYRRIYIHANGAIQSAQTPVTCDLRYGSLTPITIFDVTRSLTPVTEVCTFAPTGDAFTNRYWIDTSGFIWTSQQWASTELGHIHIERLFR